MLSNLLFDRLAAVSRPAVLFYPRRCLRARFSSSTCLACVEECQSKALTLDGKAIAFHEEKCTGCLRCSATCPNDAFTDDIDIKLLLDAIRDGEAVVLSCAKGRQCEGRIKIPCLGFLSEPLLAVITVLARKVVLLDVEHCTACVNGHCLAGIRAGLARIGEKAPVSVPPAIKLAGSKEEIPGIDRQTARRFFLQDAGKAIVNISAEVTEKFNGGPVRTETQPEKFPTRNFEALNYALERITDKKDREILTPYFYRLVVSAACDHCPLCSGMCPTGALKREKAGGSNRLVFTGDRCSGCGLCVEFCKKKALTLLPDAKRG